MDISIIIPVFNEEKNILILHTKISAVFKDLNRNYEIIYIDDGSTDESFKILKEIELRDREVKLISFERNYGQTAALDMGLHAAHGNFVLTIEADLTYDVGDLMRILNELENSDVVIGYRCNRKDTDGYVKHISSKVANYIRNKLLREDFKDAGCFLRGYKKGCLKEVILYKGFQVFMCSLMKMRGYKVKEIKIEVYPRIYGKSKYNIRNRLFKELGALLIVRWMQDHSLSYKIKYHAKL